MSNSNLVTYTRITTKKTSPRENKIDTITIHCAVGQVTAKQLCDYFATTTRNASSNYVVGLDGSIGLCVDEGDRAWTTGGKDSKGNIIRVNGMSGADNDHRAVTIEVASDTYEPYKITTAAYTSLVNLVADICKRNGIKELKWKANKSLVGNISEQNITVHRWFAPTECPGDYIYGALGQIASEVNAILGYSNQSTTSKLSYKDIEVGKTYKFTGTTQYVSAGSLSGVPAKGDKVTITSKYYESSEHPIQARSVDDQGKFIAGIYGWIDIKDLESISDSSYLVKITATELNYRRGPSAHYKKLGTLKKGEVYNIVEEQNGWGKLKSEAGWINLKYTSRV